MPAIDIHDPIFTPDQESILKALGTVRAGNAGIDLPTRHRFDCGRASYYVSDIDAAGRVYGVRVTALTEAVRGHFDIAELDEHRQSGRLYRGDLEQHVTPAQVEQIAIGRAA